jgi:hypothetical protein
VKLIVVRVMGIRRVKEERVNVSAASADASSSDSTDAFGAEEKKSVRKTLLVLALLLA